MATSDSKSVVSHCVFENNPSELKKYLYKEVAVDTCNDKTEKGWVYTIDPVSGSVVLVTFHSGQARTISIILGHTVKKIEIINDDMITYKHELDQLGGNSSNESILTKEELQGRKEKVKNWLNKNRIPFQEVNEELNIMGALTLTPPYQPENCLSANTIVLGKMQGLIKAMPENLDDW